MAEVLVNNRSRCAEKTIGISIMVGFLIALWISWDHGEKVSPRSHSSWALSLVLLCAFANSLSHIAVVSQALKRGFVLDILIGVGFDVVSSGLYDYYHVFGIATTSNWLRAAAILDMLAHVNALCALLITPNLVHCSGRSKLRHIEAVVASATNNIKGIPGPYWMDHLFAYMDTAKHLFFLGLTIQMIGVNEALKTIVKCMLAVASAVYAAQIFFQRQNTARIPRKKCYAVPKVSLAQGKVMCSCLACKNKDSLLSLYPEMCELWHCTFEELLEVISHVAADCG